jgi:hypothetical protein
MRSLAFTLAILLSATHLLAGRLTFLSRLPRSRWLSLAGGVAAAYVFLHVLPELALHADDMADGSHPASERGEVLVYLVALAGLATFYGLERTAGRSRASSRRTSGIDGTQAGVFALHLGSFALYNMLIGYLLVRREDTDMPGLWFYAVAMALHFVTNDHGLRAHHKERYDRFGRWILSAAVLVGAGAGLFLSLPAPVIGIFFAFLAGGVLLNVLKEELPEEREARFDAFLVGAAIYAALLMAAG